MKKILFIIFIALFVVNCTKKSNTSDTATNKKVVLSLIKNKNTDEKNIKKVTFIEIGSVKCVPCKMMQPVIKQIEEKYKNQVEVIFYDIWTEKDSPMSKKYGIRVIPTQVFLDKNGNEYFRHEGYFPFQELEQVLNKKGVK